MKIQMPQEIEVWYILPALRREMAKTMIKDYDLSQRDAARILGVTEAAISQYVNEKRAKNVSFDKKTLSLIKSSVQRIISNEHELLNELYKLSDFLKKSELVCQIHKKYDHNVPHSCDICFRSIAESTFEHTSNVNFHL